MRALPRRYARRDRFPGGGGWCRDGHEAFLCVGRVAVLALGVLVSVSGANHATTVASCPPGRRAATPTTQLPAAPRATARACSSRPANALDRVIQTPTYRRLRALRLDHHADLDRLLRRQRTSTQLPRCLGGRPRVFFETNEPLEAGDTDTAARPLRTLRLDHHADLDRRLRRQRQPRGGLRAASPPTVRVCSSPRTSPSNAGTPTAGRRLRALRLDHHADLDRRCGGNSTGPAFFAGA